MEPCVICQAPTSLYYKGQPLCIKCDRKREEGKDGKDGEWAKKPPQTDSDAGETGIKTAGASSSV